MDYKVKSTQIAPTGRLEILSTTEATKLLDSGHGTLHQLYRNCSLAVLNTGNELDDAKKLLERYSEFDIRIIQRPRGIKLDIVNAPITAFVDGKMIVGIQEHLFSVLRDVIFVDEEIRGNPRYNLETSGGITEGIFHILRNASVLKPRVDPNVVVCWGGHSISREEYLYTKEVGYELGLRGLDICTGCGPGAMKGPMKGATIAHAKQRKQRMRYIGVTEPGIIAAESPNPIVNHMVILPDFEKRLEAFIRLGHGIVVFPGGVGTAEEILYLLGILLREENADVPFPLVLTGPTASAPYFEQIDKFIRLTLGDKATERYTIITGDPAAVAKQMAAGVRKVREHRIAQRDSFFFNWSINIPLEYQRPFVPSHEAMAGLDLHQGRKPHELAADLRRAFSGIVAGNVKEDGMRRIEQFGPFEIHGDPEMMASLDALLRAFVEQRRMKIAGDYKPCYRVVS